jgi:hypothetical protein
VTDRAIAFVAVEHKETPALRVAGLIRERSGNRPFHNMVINQCFVAVRPNKENGERDNTDEYS